LRDRSADGLRGIAALNVMLSHFVAAFWPKILAGNYGDWQLTRTDPSQLEKVLGSPLTTLMFNGHFAVLIFFVLSGYVLASPAVDSDVGRIRARFWGRYLRLNIPVAAACILSWTVLSCGLYYAQEASLVTNSSWLAQHYKQSVSLGNLVHLVSIGGLLGDGTLIPPLWTIRMEFIGSIALLGLLALSPKNRQVFCLIVAGGALILANPSDTVYFISFIAGALCNWITVDRKHAWSLLFAGLVMGSYQPFGFHYMLPNFGLDPKTFYNAVGGVCVTVAVCRGGLFSPFMGNSIVQYFGRLSYSVYLLHFIILCSVASYIVLSFGGGPFGLVSAFLAYFLITFACAHVFTTLVDNASVRLANKFSRWVDDQPNLVQDNRKAI
jgi:peptidoglycan/LPS O-acetylase OafA/YrhL